MVSFLTKVKTFSFWLKTMDYNKAFCSDFQMQDRSTTVQNTTTSMQTDHFIVGLAAAVRGLI